MRTIITILFVLFCLDTFCQKIVQPTPTYGETNYGHWIDSNLRVSGVMHVYSLQGFPTAVWTPGNEISIMNYEIQDSVPGKQWVSLTNTKGGIIEIPKGQSSYSYQLPAISAWWRIKARKDTAGDFSFYSNAQYVPSGNVTITVPVFHTTSLTWKTAAEINVSYYLLQKTRNNVTTLVHKQTATGSGSYTYRMKATVYKYDYNITPVYRDGKMGDVKNFK